VSDDPDAPEDGTDAGSPLSALVDLAGDLVTGIPAPIRKNAFKAFAQLCTAGVEHYVTRIRQATADVRNETAERYAESQERIRLIKASGRRIGKQLEFDPAYARAAGNQFAAKIIRERLNLDEIASIADANLRNAATNPMDENGPEAAPISDDWLNVFENDAAPISSEQMQRAFGRILAGEIRRPGSFSIRTIKLIAQLDNQAADYFQLLCSLSISNRMPGRHFDARVVSMGSAAGNSLQKYGLGFGQLNILEQAGMIISDYNSFMNYRGTVAYGGVASEAITYQNKLWVLKSEVEWTDDKALHINGVGFTQSGKELLSIVDITAHDDYTADLIEFFAKQKLEFTDKVRTPGTNPQ